MPLLFAMLTVSAALSRAPIRTGWQRPVTSVQKASDMHTDSQTGQLLHDDHHRTIDLLNAFEAYLERTTEDDIPRLDADGRALLATDRKSVV